MKKKKEYELTYNKCKSDLKVKYYLRLATCLSIKE